MWNIANSEEQMELQTQKKAVPKIRCLSSFGWGMAATMAAILGITNLLIIPLWPVPITIQTMILFLTPLLFGASVAGASVLIYWALGIAGFPVFSGGNGIGAFFGPTAGYLIGFLPASVITGVLAEYIFHQGIFSQKVGRVLAVIIGHFIMYTLGVVGLAIWLGGSWFEAVMLGVTPFLVGDTIKAIVTLGLANRLWPFVQDSGLSRGKR